MQILGEKYATLLERVDKELVVLKIQDSELAGLNRVECYREYLAYRLGTRMGVPIPHTHLGFHPRYGRVSMQHYVPGANQISERFQRRLAPTRLGIRILLLDILCRNPDRRCANLLTRPPSVFAIDFNVAFQYVADAPLARDVHDYAMRWFGIEGIATLRPTDRAVLLEELNRMDAVLDNRHVAGFVEEIPDSFLECTKRDRKREAIMERRSALRAAVLGWWTETIDPLHALVWGKE